MSLGALLVPISCGIAFAIFNHAFASRFVEREEQEHMGYIPPYPPTARQEASERNRADNRLLPGYPPETRETRRAQGPAKHEPPPANPRLMDRPTGPLPGRPGETVGDGEPFVVDVFGRMVDALADALAHRIPWQPIDPYAPTEEEEWPNL